MSALKNKLTSAFKREATLRWLISLAIGVVTAFVAIGVDVAINAIGQLKFHLTSSLLDACDQCFLTPFLTYSAINLLLAAIAAYLVAFVEPLAAGSGIPEIKAYLNGVRVPRVVRFKTLLCKSVGVLFSVSSGLTAGKEGPLIHAGGIVAAGLSQGRSSTVKAVGVSGKHAKAFAPFRNDQEKRDFVSGGAAAGVAAAFGAPVGGVLFSLEEGSSFWNQALTWRTFAASMTCSFTLNVLISGIVLGQFGDLSQPGLATFGSFTEQGNPVYTVAQMPFFILLGVFGGLLGALFVHGNLILTRWRARYVCTPWARMLEVLVICTLTSVASFGASYFFKECTDHLHAPADVPLTSFTYFCPEGKYNAMASIFFTSQERAIRMLFHSQSPFPIQTLAIFFVLYFALTCLTYGIAVPSGLFVPSILAGCAFGRLFGHVLQNVLPASFQIDTGVFALVGGCAILGGIVRMTISLTVILIEATNDVMYGLPIMMTLLVAKWVGDYFNASIYDEHIEVNKVPLLEWEPSHFMRKFRATNVMSSPVVVFKRRLTAGRILDALNATSHNGYPIVDENRVFLGIILRSTLTVLLKERAFVNRDGSMNLLSLDELQRPYPSYPKAENIVLSPTERRGVIDLAPYWYAPYTINSRCSLLRVFRLFRTMGLRHLVVLDNSGKVVGMITRKDLTHLEARLLAERSRTGANNKFRE